MTRENWLYVFVGSQGIFAPARGIWACQEGISAGGVSGAGIAQARNCLLAHLPSVCLRACSTMFQKLLAMDLNNCQPQGRPLIRSHARNFSISLLACSYKFHFFARNETHHLFCLAHWKLSRFGNFGQSRSESKRDQALPTKVPGSGLGPWLGFPAYFESH